MRYIVNASSCPRYPARQPMRGHIRSGYSVSVHIMETYLRLPHSQDHFENFRPMMFGTESTDFLSYFSPIPLKETQYKSPSIAAFACIHAGGISWPPTYEENLLNGFSIDPARPRPGLP